MWSLITSSRLTDLGCSDPWDTEGSETRTYSFQFPKLSSFTFKHVTCLSFLWRGNTSISIMVLEDIAIQ